MAAVVLLAGAGCAESASVHAVSSERSIVGTALDGAETFADPQGTHTLMVDPAWATLPGAFVKEVEAWSIGIVDEGFTANINVLTQETAVDDLDASNSAAGDPIGQSSVSSGTTRTGNGERCTSS